MAKCLVCFIVVTVGLAVCWSPPASALTYSFTTVDYNPTIEEVLYNQTFLQDINDGGTVLGVSKPGVGLEKAGFLTDVGLSSFTPFNPPAWAPDQYGNGLNNAGDIAGGLGDPYLYEKATNTYFPIPPGGGYYTAADVNGDQDVVGRVGSHPGYHYSGAGNHTPINVPGATGTYPGGVNNLDSVVGTYAPGQGSFLYDGGTYYDVAITAFERTSVRGINDAGDMVGRASDAAGNIFNGIGFLYSGGTFYKIAIPGALATGATEIDNLGRIVGWYTDALTSLDLHGFIGFPGVPGQGIELPVIQGTIEEIPSAVPEPGAASILLLGLAGLASLKRRRQTTAVRRGFAAASEACVRKGEGQW